MKCLGDAFRERLIIDAELRFVGSHSTGGTACENKGINIETGFHECNLILKSCTKMLKSCTLAGGGC